MREVVVAVVAAIAVAIGGSAEAKGPSGSDEKRNDNNVSSCGTGAPAVVGHLYVAANGAELCNDGSGALPAQGRIIATSDQGGYVTADGDRDNPAGVDGFVRIDADGEVHCDDDQAKDSDATTLDGEGACDPG